MFEIRKANDADIGFIVKAIIEAEKSGTERLSYATMFGLSETEVKDLLKNAVSEDIPGQELCVSGFLLAMIDETPAATVCSWIEGYDEIPSALIKANILFHFLGSETLLKAADKTKLVEQISIPRETGTLQIESVYVDNKFRGLGVSNKLILEHIKESLETGIDLKKVQIQLAENNQSALRSYEKLGFKTIIRKKCDDSLILSFLPSDTKIMMELFVEDLLLNGKLTLSR
jgi:ribosomal protein S18 acetylase RimI-like enzyme